MNREEGARETEATCSKMLSKITGREIVNGARTPAVDVLLRARDLRWNWLGHVRRMGERRLIRQMLLNCVTSTPESVFRDLIEPSIDAVISPANDRIERKKNRPSKRW